MGHYERTLRYEHRAHPTRADSGCLPLSAIASSRRDPTCPVISSGLNSPLFVGNAGDRSKRLFIVEQGGIIRVLQSGATVPTVAGGERGLRVVDEEAAVGGILRVERETEQPTWTAP